MKKIDYMKHKRIQEKRNKWIAILLLLCLFYGDAQAYVPYIRYGVSSYSWGFHNYAYNIITL